MFATSRTAAYRRWGIVLAVSLLCTAVAGWQASKIRVDSQLVDILPGDLPASREYRQFLESFGGFERVFVLVGTPEGTEADPDRLADAAELLAGEIGRSDLVASVRWGLEETDEAFFLGEVLPRLPLLTDPEIYPRLERRLDPDAIRARVRFKRSELAGPTAALAGPMFAADPLGFAEEIGLSGRGSESFLVDPVTGAFLSPDGRTAVVVVTPAVPEFDSDAGHALNRVLEGAYAAVRDETDSDLVLDAVGGPLYAAQDERIIRGDLVRTVTCSAIGISLLLILYFRSLRIPLVLAFAVFSGILWTGAVIVWLQGTISVIGIAFASILLGLGVDYGIHGATRFRQELLAGHDRPGAMALAIRTTGPAILTSALTTVAAFVVLVFAQFHPVRELGLVVALGIAILLIASVALGGSLLVLLPAGPPDRRQSTGSGWLWRGVRWFVDTVVDLSRDRPRTVLGVIVLVTVLAGVGLPRLDFSANLAGMRPEEHPAQRGEHILTETFGMGLDTFTVVLRGDDLGDALTRAARVKHALARRMGPGAEISSPSDFLAAGGVLEDRLAAWPAEKTRRALEVLEDELERDGFVLEAFAPALEVLHDLARREPPAAPAPEDWPDWIAELIRRGDSGVEVALRVRAPKGRWPNGPPQGVIDAIKVVDPTAAVASVPRLGAELRSLVGDDLRRLGAWCLVAIAAIAVLSFRGRLGPALLALLPVLLGSFWVLGFSGGIGLIIDPISMTVVPVLLGIGIDDGLHALHGTGARGDLVASLKQVGQAMTLTTLTTCIGFGTLVFSRVPSLRSGGALVAVGTALCLLATLLVIPALDALFPNRAVAGGD